MGRRRAVIMPLLKFVLPAYVRAVWKTTGIVGGGRRLEVEGKCHGRHLKVSRL